MQETTYQPSYVYVTCYNRFENLAHAPCGKPAKDGIHVYELNPTNGGLKWLTAENSCPNPAFVRFHPERQMLYTCSESITDDDRLYSYEVNDNGTLELSERRNLKGKSACFLSIDKARRHLLYVNYWDSTLGTVDLNENGRVGDIKHLVRAEKKVVARHRGDHLRNRQSESHAHCIVLDRSGRVAFVPDLGRDVVHQFVYDDSNGSLKAVGNIAASNEKGPHGPRYLDFHPTLNCAYLINELSSTISVFHVDNDAIDEGTGDFLVLRQTISTLPDEPQTVKNTCGRISVHESGNFLFASNRGHDSLAAYRISKPTGMLEFIGCTKTGGRTPRHFKFEPTGRFCYVANQDSNDVAVFSFDEQTGAMRWLTKYEVESPNFIAIQGEKPHSQHYHWLPEQVGLKPLLTKL